MANGYVDSNSEVAKLFRHVVEYHDLPKLWVFECFGKLLRNGMWNGELKCLPSTFDVWCNIPATEPSVKKQFLYLMVVTIIDNGIFEP